MIRRNYKILIILMLSSLALLSCNSSKKTVGSTPTINSKVSQEKPYLILISLDGFRWDYVEKYKPVNISNFIKNGVRASSLISSFPSKTFPNHYSIATGMYPDKHRIIGNTFYSYQNDVIYKIGNREIVEDGSFYGGLPIWALADRAKMVSASYFFVGSEAAIQGVKPTYHYSYDGNVKNETRVAKALDWLQLPKQERPHIITMYFSDMDDVGHKYGPSNDEKLQKALFDLDANLGNLFNGVNATGLPVNIIIVSDHGMSDQVTENFIPFDALKNDSLYKTINNGTMINIHPKNDSDIDFILQNLKQQENHFKVYKTANTPGFEYTPKNKDWGAIQIVANNGYYFNAEQTIASIKNASITNVGVHGYDPEHKDMHGIFYANGPAFKQNIAIPAFKNIHIYPLMCTILGLEIPNDIDGKLDVLEGILKTD